MPIRRERGTGEGQERSHTPWTALIDLEGNPISELTTQEILQNFGIRRVYIFGEPGGGKTAILSGMAQELQERYRIYPFMHYFDDYLTMTTRALAITFGAPLPASAWRRTEWDIHSKTMTIMIESPYVTDFDIDPVTGAGKPFIIKQADTYLKPHIPDDYYIFSIKAGYEQTTWEVSVPIKTKLKAEIATDAKSARFIDYIETSAIGDRGDRNRAVTTLERFVSLGDTVFMAMVPHPRTQFFAGMIREWLRATPPDQYWRVKRGLEKNFGDRVIWAFRKKPDFENEGGMIVEILGNRTAPKQGIKKLGQEVRDEVDLILNSLDLDWGQLPEIVRLPKQVEGSLLFGDDLDYRAKALYMLMRREKFFGINPNLQKSGLFKIVLNPHSDKLRVLYL